MNKIIAMGLACCLPLGLAAEDPQAAQASLGMVDVLVIEDSSPVAQDVMCARSAGGKDSDCMAAHRAVLTARIQKVSALRERGRWM